MAIQIHEAGTPKKTFGQKLAGGFNQALEIYAQHAEKEKTKKLMDKENQQLQSLVGEDISGLNPELKKTVLAERLKGQASSKKTGDELAQNRQLLRAIENSRNLEPGSLSAYESDPKMAEITSRPPKEPKKTQASQPIDPKQLETIQKVRSSPGYNDMDEVDQYRALTNAGVSKENAEVESKLTGNKLERQQKGIESAYKAQEDFINETTKKYSAFESETKPRLLQMQKLANDDDLIGPTASAFLETMGIPLGALEDPSSELYQKLSLDLLKGLPETYGNRIMKVEVDNFLKTIPTLLNSPEGRRMIASNMLKLGEMKEVYYNEMRRQQKSSRDSNKPLARDFQQEVFDQVKPQIDRINDEFVKMSEIKSIPKDTIPFFYNGNIKFVPKKDAQWASENGGRRIW